MVPHIAVRRETGELLAKDPHLHLSSEPSVSGKMSCKERIGSLCGLAKAVLLGVVGESIRLLTKISSWEPSDIMVT